MTEGKRILGKLLYALNELLPMLFWIILMLGFNEIYAALLTMCAAVIHELGHYATVLMLKCDTGMPIGHISGFRIRERSMMSYEKSIAVLAMGPGANLLVGALTLAIAGSNTYLTAFAVLNLATAFSNLIPVEGYDGYAILAQIACRRGSDRALRVLDTISFATISAVCLFSLLLMYIFNTGYWICGIFLVLLISGISKSLSSDVF